jgi:hypothetical protein
MRNTRESSHCWQRARSAGDAPLRREDMGRARCDDRVLFPKRSAPTCPFPPATNLSNGTTTKAAASALACATGQVEASETIMDAALPFASLFAGLLVAADLVRAQLPGPV